MLSEVVNALFVTYVATEIQLADPGTSRVHDVLQSKLTQALTIAVVLVNLSVRLHMHVSGSALLSAANSAVSFASHAPKVVFAAVAYVVALYFDCKRSKEDLAAGDFLKESGDPVLSGCTGVPIPRRDDIICVFVHHQRLRGLAFAAGNIEHADLLWDLVRSLLLDILHGEEENSGKQFITSQHNDGVLCKMRKIWVVAVCVGHTYLRHLS